MGIDLNKHRVRGPFWNGLSISAAMGVRDNNEASWTQVLEVLEFMSDVTNIPILLDGDTGYGNFNNMRRLVSKLADVPVFGSLSGIGRRRPSYPHLLNRPSSAGSATS